MSLQIQNSLSRGIAARIRALASRQLVLDAAGAELVSIARGAFADPALRALPWPSRAKSPGARAGRPTWDLLRKSGALHDSIRVMRVSTEGVSVGSDLPYAAVHQFGSAHRKGRGGGIPARPFFPYDAAGAMTALARARVQAIMARRMRRLLRLS